MRRKTAFVVLGLLLGLLGSCGFHKEQVTGDAALPPLSIGFAQDSQLQDEASGAIVVVVRLSRASTEEISVSYAITEGTGMDVATLGDDYTAVPTGTLTFAPGSVEEVIPIEIKADGVDERNETIELMLSNPSGSVALGKVRHVITINALPLPRVGFSLADSSANEAIPMATLTLTLDTAHLVESTATIAVRPTGTTAAETYDYTLATELIVTFPANTTTATVDIPIVDDSVDEDDERVVVEIANTSNVVPDMLKKEHTRTITNDDTAPTVEFMVGSGSGNEGPASVSTNVDVIVRLSGPSGKIVTVPVTFGGGTATENSDYTYASKTDLVFMPNQDSSQSEVEKTIVLSILGDTTDEVNQTVITSLITLPTNATIGTPATHTYTITDDDQAPTVEFITASQSVMEGDTGPPVPTSYTMQLSEASERMISYDVAFVATTNAVIPDDFTTLPAPNMGDGSVTITIAPGATQATITLLVEAEMVDEGANETITMLIGAPLINVRAMGGDAKLKRVHTIADSD